MRETELSQTAPTNAHLSISWSLFFICTIVCSHCWTSSCLSSCASLKALAMLSTSIYSYDPTTFKRGRGMHYAPHLSSDGVCHLTVQGLLPPLHLFTAVFQLECEILCKYQFICHLLGHMPGHSPCNTHNTFTFPSSALLYFSMIIALSSLRADSSNHESRAWGQGKGTRNLSVVK